MDTAAHVRRAQAGDMEAAEQLLLAHLPGVLRMLRRLLPSRADAEDVAQETCLHALVGLCGLRRPELYGSWLRTIAYNRAMQWQRRRYAEAAASPRLWEPGATDGEIQGTAGTVRWRLHRAVERLRGALTDPTAEEECDNG